MVRNGFDCCSLSHRERVRVRALIGTTALHLAIGVIDWYVNRIAGGRFWSVS